MHGALRNASCGHALSISAAPSLALNPLASTPAALLPQTCDGSGVKSGTTPSTCPQCSGSGQFVQAVRTPLGAFQQVSTCPRCEGTGQVFVPCEKCAGDGRVRESKRISLKVPPGEFGIRLFEPRLAPASSIGALLWPAGSATVPPSRKLERAGVDSGSKLRVRGEGNSGRRGGGNGDLFVQISVKDHPELRRDGTTIHSDVEVAFTEAILGTQVGKRVREGMHARLDSEGAAVCVWVCHAPLC